MVRAMALEPPLRRAALAAAQTTTAELRAEQETHRLQAQAKAIKVEIPLCFRVRVAAVAAHRLRAVLETRQAQPQAQAGRVLHQAFLALL